MAIAPENSSAPERGHSKVRRWAGRGKVFVDRIQALKRRLSIVGRRYIFLLFVGCIVLLVRFLSRRFPEWHLYITAVLWENLLPLSILLIALLFSLLRWLLWKLPKQQVEGIGCEKDRLTAESGFRQPLIQIVQTLVQIVGGTALLGGLYYTAQTLRTSQDTLRVNQKTLETTQQGQITERFTKAIEQLGSDNRAIRLGGIYALERIARESETDHWPVMEVLTAFVREQAPAQSLSENTPQDGKEQQPLVKLLEEKGFDVFQEAVYVRIKTQRLRADIQAILTILGRRTRTYENGESQRLNLQFTNLQHADLQGAQLQGAMLDGAQLQGANLRGVKLQHASLSGADLQNTFMIEVELQDADLKWANLQNAMFIYAKLQRARLNAARLQGAGLAHCELQGADFSRARMQSSGGPYSQFQGAMLDEAQLQGAYLDRAENLTQDQINTACVDENTRLPAGLIRPAPCPANP